MMPAAPPLLHARCTACWIVAGIAVLVVASFSTLDLKWAAFLSADAAARMGRFLAELASPSTDPEFLLRVALASAETLAMSALGTLLAVAGGLALALPDAVQKTTLFSIGLHALAPEPDATRALMRFLASPEAAPVIRAKGMQPLAG